MNTLTATSAPFLVLSAWLAAELVRFSARRRPSGGRGEVWTRIGVLAMRPWAVWAVFNALCRLHAEKIFNDPRTFPLYAGPWTDDPLPAYFRRVLAAPEFWIWSLAAAGLATVLILFARAVLRRKTIGPGRTVLAAGLLCLLAFAFWSSVACLPRGACPRSDGDPGSFLRVWHTPGSTFLYVMPHIKSPGHFIRNFAAIQPRLRPTIHGVTHPPGAALSLYWAGRLFGASPARIRENDQKVRYALALIALAALNVAAVCLLARGVFRSSRTGLLVATLWVASPAATAYGVFAQDMVYALFFHLGLAGIWFAVTGKRRPATGLGLGAVFFVLTMMTFSWIILAAVFAVFAVLVGIRRGWSRADWLVRGLLPPAVMVFLSGAVLLIYRLDYLAVYRFAHDYHSQWYRYTGAGQWLLALAGGQLEMILMMGTVPAAICLGLLFRRRRLPLSPAGLFLAVTVAAYLLPIVFGPNPLKMETSRCWIWVLSLPLAFAARRMENSPRPAIWFTGSIVASVLASYLLRLFVNFGV